LRPTTRFATRCRAWAARSRDCAFAAAIALAISGWSLLTWSAKGQSSPGSDSASVKVTALSAVNSPADEDHPRPAPSNLALYFVRTQQGDRPHIMVARRRAASQPFSAAAPIEELNEGAGCTDLFPMPADPDGSEYIFAVRRAGANNLDIYFTRRLRPTEPFQVSAWGAVHNVCTPEDEADPWVRPDNREIYFSRRTPEGWRIGRAWGVAPRSFENVELLSFPAGFRHPFLSRDGLTMFLQGPDFVAEGEDDSSAAKSAIYVSRRSSRTAAWGQPKPLTLLRHPQSKRGEASPSLSPDGRYLYFASDRPGGKGGLDLYYVSVSDLKAAGF
jgi:hypothetical protein